MVKPSCIASCDHCGTQFARRDQRARYCSRTCANRAAASARLVHLDPTSKSRRAQRCSVAPGLSYTQRVALLRRWQRQRRSCSYCDRAATTIDHVVPLIRGGTNHEGNLAPACRTCNSSKGRQLLTEWRTGRRCTVTLYVLPSPPKRTKPEAPPLVPLPCSECGTTYMPKSTRQRCCSAQCSADRNRRRTGERHRTRDLKAAIDAAAAWRALARA